MGHWSTAETELTIHISAGDPHAARVRTNWRRFATRFERCEGFETTSDFEAADGGREISGTLDLGAGKYLWLRRDPGSDAARARFAAQAAKLQPVSVDTPYRPDAGE